VVAESLPVEERTLVRTSVIIAAHNEGPSLRKTVQSCIETSAGLDYEIIVSDDASNDGSIDEVEQRFTQVRIHGGFNRLWRHSAPRSAH
jgi:glycosyltransferase involved in cell wall biosynthesis